VGAIAYRQARLDDAADIHALLLRLAPEVPLLVDTLEREEALYALTRTCARSGESWIALDEENRIVGFVLVEPNQLGRHYAENEILDLRYAGVAPGQRNQGIFTSLIGQVLARMVPVTTSVAQQNRSGMVQRLEKLGFRHNASPGGELRLRWEPGARN
jgi:GNAT superfamily N-acetyltransferase